MKLCVVGNGPSAKGHGAEIDACDFVVRLKAWWVHGAEDAGERIDAWAWFGDANWAPETVSVPVSGCEHWFTQCDKQMSKRIDFDARWGSFIRLSQGEPTQRLTDDLWERVQSYLERDPSTGCVAVAMAMELFRPDELLLVGFDSTTADAPNYTCARIDWGRTFAHAFDKEKLAFAEIRDGTWLGGSVQTCLKWIGEPDVASECDVRNPGPLRIDQAAGETAG